ncbi:hypothetical protein [Bacillus sp. FJAT-22090]|uniref:hypothetical protein n=1 Tax=Bacillus sp. FJAT-22090 TaxID=1581038 RepID=UPI00119E6549|nr:hypothetical protein [Bacillus sp. FJAT-22090]
MSYNNDPLLFIKGPPVFHLPPGVRVEIQMEEEQDESTSIYEIRSSMTEKTIAILDKLKFLSKPFQRKVYRPLVFHLEDGALIQGEVDSVDDEQVTFSIGAGELMTYKIDQVKRIVWRGVEMK